MLLEVLIISKLIFLIEVASSRMSFRQAFLLHLSPFSDQLSSKAKRSYDLMVLEIKGQLSVINHIASPRSLLQL